MLGMVPVRALLFRFRVVSGKLPHTSGIWPDKLLLDRIRVAMFVRLPKVAGRLPLSTFPPASKSVRLTKLPMLLGIEP